jgi:hypothetical protein
MRPHDGACAAGLFRNPLAQRIQRLHHVRIAQVPRLDAATEHGAVILLGVADQTRVLLREEELVLRHAAVAIRVLRGPAPQLDQLRNDIVLTRA